MPSECSYQETSFFLTVLFRQVITLNIPVSCRFTSPVFGHLCCSRLVFLFICIVALREMAQTRVLILGHSFIHRLRSFLIAKYSLAFLTNFHLGDDLVIRWQGTGGRTVAKTIQYDLGVVESFAPEIVILQLGTNDLASLSAVETGSAIEDLTRLLFESYGVKFICVCQTIYRENTPSFNTQVNILTRYLKVVLEPIPYVLYWRHRGFWNCKSRFLARDGMHFNTLGQYKFFRSLRGAVLRCLRAIAPS